MSKWSPGAWASGLFVSHGAPWPRIWSGWRGRQRHKEAIATSKNSLHIPLEQKGQLPRERRAVGAIKAAARRFFRPKVLKNACLWDFFPKECGIFGKNDLNCLSRMHRLASWHRKTASVAGRPWAIASRFVWKTKKSADGVSISEKLFIFAPVY